MLLVFANRQLGEYLRNKPCCSIQPERIQAEHADGQEEGAPGGDPAGVIRRQTTGGQYAVDIGMKLQALIPAVEHAEEAYLGPKMPGIASDLKQGLGAGMKEQVR